MLNISKIKAITLDLDDTLWPVWPSIAGAERALNDWLAPRAPGAAALIGDANSRLALREAVQAQRPDKLHDMSFLRLEMLRQALLLHGEDVALMKPAFEIFLTQRMRVELYDDALPALTFLAQRFAVVAVSNGNADVHRVGIGAHFHSSVSAHMLGVAKPDVRIFQAAAANAGVAVDEVLHVGDDAVLDVLGGLNAGMQTVWVNRAGHEWAHPQQPHVTVSTLEALCRLLADVPVLRG